MDPELHRHGYDAVAGLEHVLERGPEASHTDIRAATLAVIAFRDRVIEKYREGAASEACLREANALVSMAFGGEFPLSGLHRDRFEKTRDGMRALLQEE